MPELLRDLPDSPLAAQGEELATFSGALLVFRNLEGVIVAHWPLMLAWHAEPCYVHPDHRGSGDLIHTMVHSLRLVMGELGVPVAFASADEPAVVRILRTLGFQRAPGEMYYAYAATAVGSDAPAPPPQEPPR